MRTACQFVCILFFSFVGLTLSLILSRFACFCCTRVSIVPSTVQHWFYIYIYIYSFNSIHPCTSFNKTQKLNNHTMPQRKLMNSEAVKTTQEEKTHLLPMISPKDSVYSKLQLRLRLAQRRTINTSSSLLSMRRVEFQRRNKDAMISASSKVAFVTIEK
jgi:hypothetical protein